MSIFTNWLRKSSTQALLKASLAILKVLAFGVGEKLWLVVRTEVERVHDLPMTNTEKFKTVAEAVKQQLPGVKDSLVNLSIELAYNHLRESLIKK